MRVESLLVEAEALYAPEYGEVDLMAVLNRLDEISTFYLASLVLNAHTMDLLTLQTVASTVYQPTYAVTPNTLSIAAMMTEASSVYTPTYEEPVLMTVPLVTEAETLYLAAVIQWTINFNESPGLITVPETVYTPVYAASPVQMSLDLLSNPGTLYAPTVAEGFNPETSTPYDLIIQEWLSDWGAEFYTGNKTFTEVTTDFLEVSGAYSIDTTAANATTTERRLQGKDPQVDPAWTEANPDPPVLVTWTP